MQCARVYELLRSDGQLRVQLHHHIAENRDLNAQLQVRKPLVAQTYTMSCFASIGNIALYHECNYSVILDSESKAASASEGR